MRELLTAAYYELPLAGAWYHVHPTSDADLSNSGMVVGGLFDSLSVQEALKISVDPRFLHHDKVHNNYNRSEFKGYLDLTNHDEYLVSLQQAIDSGVPSYTEIEQHVKLPFMTLSVETEARCGCGDPRAGIVPRMLSSN